jgi:hypothetical protein
MRTPDTADFPAKTDETRVPAESRRRHLLRIVLILGGLVAGLSAMMIALGLPAVQGGPDGVRIGVIADRTDSVPIVSALRQQGFNVETYADRASLIDAAKDRQIDGGLVADPGRLGVVVASAEGLPISQSLQLTAAHIGEATGLTTSVTDVAPLTQDDPRGSGLGAASLPMIFGGIIPAVALTRLVPGPTAAKRRVAGAVAFSILGGLALSAILEFWFGSVDDNFWAVGLGLALGTAAISLPFLGLETVFGFGGLVGGIVSMMFIANPLSGLAAGVHWLPPGWSTAGQLMPPGASATLLRASGFFDDAGAGGPIAVLAVWAIAGAALSVVHSHVQITGDDTGRHLTVERA